MALYIPHSIFNLARLLYVRPETFGLYYVFIYLFIYLLLVVCLQTLLTAQTASYTVK